MTEEEKKEYNKKYYIAHKKERSAYYKKYKKEHKEEKSAYNKDYYKENKNTVSLKHKNKNNESKKRADNHRQIWEYNDYLILERYLKEGKTHKEIAILMGRSIYAITMRVYLLKKEGNPYNKK